MTLNSFIMGRTSSSKLVFTTPFRKSILLPTRITGTYCQYKSIKQNPDHLERWHELTVWTIHLHPTAENKAASTLVFDRKNAGCRWRIRHIWHAPSGFQILGALCPRHSLVKWNIEGLSVCSVRRVRIEIYSHTACVNNICVHILRCYFWRNGYFWNDMLNLVKWPFKRSNTITVGRRHAHGGHKIPWSKMWQ